jgi:hypothetical protein
MRRALVLAALVLPAAALTFPAGAAQRPTLVATPLVVGELSQVALTGTSGSSKAGETVIIQAKECQSDFFRVVAAARTSAGGSWAQNTNVANTTSFRARSRGVYSRPVVVRKRAVVALAQRPRTRMFDVTVFGPALNGRMVRLERSTPRGWVLVSQAKLHRHALFGVLGVSFRVVRRGLVLRAVITRASALPCFLGGSSKVVRS